MFKVDWFKFVVHNIPSTLRTVTRLQWLQVIVSPVRKLMATMKTYRANKLYDLNHSGQVIYLEKVLNDQFDPVHRRIYIGDGDFRNRIYIKARAADDYLYWRDQQDVAYNSGNKAQFGFEAWESTQNGNIDSPSANPSGWTKVRDAFRVKERNQYNYGIGFIIYVPATLQYNYPRFKATVDFYRVAGRQWRIETF